MKRKVKTMIARKQVGSFVEGKENIEGKVDLIIALGWNKTLLYASSLFQVRNIFLVTQADKILLLQNAYGLKILPQRSIVHKQAICGRCVHQNISLWLQMSMPPVITFCMDQEVITKKLLCEYPLHLFQEETTKTLDGKSNIGLRHRLKYTLTARDRTKPQQQVSRRAAFDKFLSGSDDQKV